MPFMTVEDKTRCMWTGPPDKKRKISNVSEVNDQFNAMKEAQHIFAKCRNTKMQVSTNRYSCDINTSINTVTTVPSNTHKITPPHSGNAFAPKNEETNKQNNP